MKRIVLGLLALVPTSTGAAAASSELELERVRVHLRGKVNVTARFDPTAIPAGWDTAEDGFRITLNDIPVVEASYARGRFKDRAGLLRLYREKGEIPVRVRLDLGDGRIRIKAWRVALPPDWSPARLTLRLVFLETELTGSAVPDVKGRKLRLRGAKAPKVGGAIAFRRLDADDWGPWGTSGALRVARNEEELAELWAEIHENGLGASPPTPDVDFDIEMVVGVILGFRPSSGYSMKVLDVRERGDGAHVVYREWRTGGDCITQAVVTGPWALVAIPRRPGPVTAECRVRHHHCR